MRKTWSILCAAVLLTLTLAGCSSDKTQGGAATATPSDSAAPSAAAPSATPSAASSPELHGTEESGDLADEDGMLDGDAGTDNDGITPGGQPGQGDDSALEKAGDGIRDTLDDLGDAARDVGRGAKNMIEGQ